MKTDPAFRLLLVALRRFLLGMAGAIGFYLGMPKDEHELREALRSLLQEN